MRSYHLEFGLDYTIFRFFNTYGPKQSKDFVVSKFLTAALKDEDITIYGDGLQTRTFCFISDNTEACLNVFYKDEVINDVINIGSNREVTILELAETIIRLTDSKSQIVHLSPLEEGDMTRRLPDNSRMLNILDRELVPLEKGLEHILHSNQFASH